MKRFLLTVAVLFTVLTSWHGSFLHAEETPPYEVKQWNVSENFRKIYYDVDKLSLLTSLLTYTSSTNVLCIDSPTFCVNGNNNSISANIINSTNSWLNVKYYGAKGDGVTDDIPAFQSALAAVGVGGTVFVPNGKYYLNNFLVVPGSTTLYCDGNGASILVHGTGVPLAGANFIYLGGLTSHIPYGNIENCSIEGNWPNTIGFTNFELTMGWKSLAKNIEIKNFTMRGIDSSDFGEDSTIENPYIVGIGTANAYPAQGDGIWGLSASPGTVNKGLRIINPTISNMRNSAIFVDSNGGQIFGGHLYHNHCQETPVGGGQLAIGDTMVVGILIDDGCGAATTGIEENGGSQIIGGMVSENQNYGAFIQNAGTSTFRGTVFKNNGRFGGAQIGVNAVSTFSIIGVTTYEDDGLGTNPYPLYIAAGPSNHYSVIGNNFVGPTRLFDGGTGTDKIIQFNLGEVQTFVSSNGTNTFTGATAFTSTNVSMNSINGASISGPRNMIVNGDMRIDQRWVGTTSTCSTASTIFANDQWKHSGVASNGSFTVQRIATNTLSGFTHCLQLVVTSTDGAIAATNRYYLRQVLEGSSVKHLKWGSVSGSTCTLSFWVLSSSAGTTQSVCFSNGSRSYAATYPISTPNTWEKKTLIIPPDITGTWGTADGGTGMTVTFPMGAGSSRSITAGSWQPSVAFAATGIHPLIAVYGSTFCLTGVQFEIGSIASAFEYTPDYEMLRRCQRFYWKSFAQTILPANNQGSTAGEIGYFTHVAGLDTDGIGVRLPVTMDTTPSMTSFNPSAANAKWRNETDGADSGTSAFTNVGDSGFVISNTQVAITDGLGEVLTIHVTADAGL